MRSSEKALLDLLKLPGPCLYPWVPHRAPPRLQQPHGCGSGRLWGGSPEAATTLMRSNTGPRISPPRHEHLQHNAPWTHRYVLAGARGHGSSAWRFPGLINPLILPKQGSKRRGGGRQGVRRGWSVGKGRLSFIFPYFARATTCTHILGVQGRDAAALPRCCHPSLAPRGGQNTFPGSMQRPQLCSCTSLLYVPLCLCHRSPSHRLRSNLLGCTPCQPRLPASSPRHLRADLGNRSPVLLLPLLLHPGHCLIATP